jgi:hypothetical protein
LEIEYSTCQKLNKIGTGLAADEGRRWYLYRDLEIVVMIVLHNPLAPKEEANRTNPSRREPTVITVKMIPPNVPITTISHFKQPIIEP